MAKLKYFYLDLDIFFIAEQWKHLFRDIQGLNEGYKTKVFTEPEYFLEQIDQLESIGLYNQKGQL